MVERAAGRNVRNYESLGARIDLNFFAVRPRAVAGPGGRFAMNMVSRTSVGHGLCGLDCARVDFHASALAAPAPGPPDRMPVVCMPASRLVPGSLSVGYRCGCYLDRSSGWRVPIPPLCALVVCRGSRSMGGGSSGGEAVGSRSPALLAGAQAQRSYIVSENRHPYACGPYRWSLCLVADAAQ